MPLSTDPRCALLLIDLQPDFMPGGALACHQGDAILADIERLLQSGRFQHFAATQDWHPAGHISFASSHAGRAPFESISLHGHAQTLWPDHCVQGSPGAQLHPAIDWRHADVIVRKGSDPQVDSYSGFRENHGPLGLRPATGLTGWLRERAVEEVFICGLARDVCVLWTAQDAVHAGFRAHVLWDLTRPVSHASDPATRAALAQAGIGLIKDERY
jgi:nicotinamidase/pyrazinamidase